jgi:threonine synthase
MKLHSEGYFSSPAKVVSVLTGNGLKDPDNALAGIEQPRVVNADKEKIIKAIWGQK